MARSVKRCDHSPHSPPPSGTPADRGFPACQRLPDFFCAARQRLRCRQTGCEKTAASNSGIPCAVLAMAICIAEKPSADRIMSSAPLAKPAHERIACDHHVDDALIGLDHALAGNVAHARHGGLDAVLGDCRRPGGRDSPPWQARIPLQGGVQGGRDLLAGARRAWRRRHRMPDTLARVLLTAWAMRSSSAPSSQAMPAMLPAAALTAPQ